MRGTADMGHGDADARALTGREGLDSTSAGRVAVGIDAGGSGTRARAVADGHVVHEGGGGPGNPLAAPERVLAASYQAALAGCPAAAHVAACVSGTGGERQRAQIAGLLAGLVPAAEIRVVPDYAGALLAAPEGTDVVVIAGTGSVVCSQATAGGHHVSGGRGWILGDRGSAARLGQAALEWFCADAERDPDAVALVKAHLGLTGWRRIVGALSASPHPSALLARAAPVLTRAAEQGAAWAAARLDAEMAALAATTAGHAGRYLHPGSELRVALAGGVWASGAATASFTAALSRDVRSSRVIVTGPVDPLDGAVRLALSMIR